VSSKLGQGGMGEVWRASDTKLGREVALKVLPEVFAQDPERLARFEREARVLASLSHPNIAGIHGLEEVGGKRFLVMELVEGETLAERIGRGPLGVEEAVRIAKEIAEAVEAAHEKGVVHRDLKPANVKLTPEGKVKVLDFGLAKALIGDPMSGERSTHDLSLSPTLTQAMTGLGVLLGTAAYMSPEQARGKPVDRRADVWAFGCILYEMLSGRRLFSGETATDVIGAVVHKEPELEELGARVPGRIRRLLERCLQKDPTRRLQSIGEARVALQEWLENPAADPVAPAAGARRWPWVAAAGAACALVLGAYLGATFLGARSEPEPLRRSVIQVGENGLFTGFGASAVLSPDGEVLALVTGSGNEGGEIHLRPLDRFEPSTAASGGAGEAPYQPFFSPDGEWLGYVTPAEMKKVSTAGGAPITLCKVDLSRGATWGPDGTIVFAAAPRGGLSRVSSAGGEPQPLTALSDGNISHRWPQWLPGGKAVLFTSIDERADNFEGANLEVVTVASGERTIVHRGGYHGRYVATGHILYVHEGTLFALPFDVGRLEATGSQMPVLEGLESTVVQGAAQFDVAENGVLVYASESQQGDPFPVVWVDRNGRTEPLWSEPGLYGNPELSPDGRKLSVSLLRGNNLDIWVYDLGRNVATRLTFDEGYDADQIWSPDGRFIAFSSNRGTGNNAIFRKAADGSGETETLVDSGDLPALYPTSWSPDGRWITVWTANSDIHVASVDSRRLEPFQATTFGEFNPSFSPDGRWIAYDSNESGRLEIYVRAFPAGGGKWQVSDGGGALARWSDDGRELFYRTDDGVMVVEVNGRGSNFEVGTPRKLFEGPFLGGTNGIAVGGFVFPDYTVSGDGQRFVMFAGREETNRPTSVRLVTNWFDELRRLTAVGSR
jgi:serine/threonine-protein kinase